MADPLQFNTPFSLKNFLASKGTSGLESIFNHVPDKMKISILQAMHKMHPVQAENFMMNLYNEYVSKLGTGADTDKNYYRWLSEKIQPKIAGSGYDIGQRLPLEGPWAGGQDTGYTNIKKIPFEQIKKLRLQLANPNLDAGTRKMIENFLKMHTTDVGKYEMALLNQLRDSGKDIVTNVIDDVEVGKSRIMDHTIPKGEVIDFKTKKILNPKYPYPTYQPKIKQPLSISGTQAVVPKGIPWSTYGMRLLNNPVTKTIGGLGNVALGATTFSDIFFGTDVGAGSMARDINKWMGVPPNNSPTDRQGNVIHSNRVYNNLQNVAQRDVLNPNEMRGVTSFDTTRYNPREMNTGGIVSLML